MLTQIRASLLPSTSIALAAFSTISRIDSISQRACAMICRLPPRWAIFLPKASRVRPRVTIMQDEPTTTELINAVADFLRSEIAPVITGHNAFKLRVGINALDLVARQLALEETSDAAEATRLKQLLGADGALIELNRLLCDRIAKGEVDLATPGLSDHLWQTTMDKLAVDQPNYASYKRELGS